MKKLAVVVLALAFVASMAYAEEAQKANEPVGKVVEATGTVVGKVVSVITTGSDKAAEGTVTVVDETGKTMMFPVDPTVKIVDATVNAITLNQLKEGEKVKVDYSKEGGSEKAKAISVTK